MPPGSRFGPTQVMPSSFPHLQQSHLQHHSTLHRPSSNFPPPSFATASTFSHSSQSPFTSSATTNGLGAGFGASGSGGLASPAGVMGFPRGDHMSQQQQQQQQHQARDSLRRGGSGGRPQTKSRIRDVWAGNLAQEMATLRELVERYPYISMDTEFPGVTARPMGRFNGRLDYHYQTLRLNVDLMNIIQLGISLYNANGEPPPAYPDSLTSAAFPNDAAPCPTTWQFNFRFHQDSDMHNPESIAFLLTHGMNVEMHEHQGIEFATFASLLVSSGLVFLDEVKWISFHSGYDFAYLVKIVYGKAFPEGEAEYRKLLHLMFPSIYDVKFMVKTIQKSAMVNNGPLSPAALNFYAGLGIKASLQDLADELGIKRVGQAHQAGSDSLITGRVFWEFKKVVMGGIIEEERFLNRLWGLDMLAHGHGGSLDDAQSPPHLNGATIYTSATPSTPSTSHTGLAHTPNQQGNINGAGVGALTPGGGGGVFGRFGFK